MIKSYMKRSASGWNCVSRSCLPRLPKFMSVNLQFGLLIMTATFLCHAGQKQQTDLLPRLANLLNANCYYCFANATFMAAS
jgi:hypothetical protein